MRPHAQRGQVTAPKGGGGGNRLRPPPHPGPVPPGGRGHVPRPAHAPPMLRPATLPPPPPRPGGSGSRPPTSDRSRSPPRGPPPIPAQPKSPSQIWDGPARQLTWVVGAALQLSPQQMASKQLTLAIRRNLFEQFSKTQTKAHGYAMSPDLQKLIDLKKAELEASHLLVLCRVNHLTLSLCHRLRLNHTPAPRCGFGANLHNLTISLSLVRRFRLVGSRKLK